MVFQTLVNYQIKIGRYIKISIVTIFLVTLLTVVTSMFVVKVEGVTTRNVNNQKYDLLSEIRELNNSLLNKDKLIGSLESDLYILEGKMISLRQSKVLSFLNEYR